jgi:hypothetical protein
MGYLGTQVSPSRLWCSSRSFKIFQHIAPSSQYSFSSHFFLFPTADLHSQFSSHFHFVYHVYQRMDYSHLWDGATSARIITVIRPSFHGSTTRCLSRMSKPRPVCH